MFFPRTTLVILNNLKFKYANGGNTAMIQITETTFLGIIKSFVEIAYKVVWEMSNIASWLLMCDEILDNTLPDIVQCSSREVRRMKMQELQKQNEDRSTKCLITNHNPASLNQEIR